MNHVTCVMIVCRRRRKKERWGNIESFERRLEAIDLRNMKTNTQIVPAGSVKTATVDGEVEKEPFGILAFQHDKTVYSIAFSHDSKYIAAGGRDIWNFFCSTMMK